MLYSTLFMMAGERAVARSARARRLPLPHVLDAHASRFDLALYVLFFVPGMAALIYSGWGFFDLSYAMNERSSFSRPDRSSGRSRR